MRLLLLDIETSPSLAYVWGLWENNVSLNQLVKSGTVMCWSAKWIGEDRMFFGSTQHGKPKEMLTKIHSLLSMADAVVTWNGMDFDCPILNREFLRYGLDPPAPYAQIDLMRVAKKRFKFVSNKLEYVAKRLKCGEKMKNEGFELWTKCLAGNREAWAHMREYNINDTKILEALYNKFLPWIPNHPSAGLHDGNPDNCPNCGGSKLQHRGWTYTKLGKYQRFQCLGCGSWTRSGKRVMLASHQQVAV